MDGSGNPIVVEADCGDNKAPKSPNANKQTRDNVSSRTLWERRGGVKWPGGRGSEGICLDRSVETNFYVRPVGRCF